jgi:hypothetical protein
MNRNPSQPVILPLPTVAAIANQPSTIPFPTHGRSFRRGHNRRRADRRQRTPAIDDRNSPLGEMRERLLKMIIANEWDRSHGNRAS